MQEPRLKELSGASRLALGFFNSLIRRIECTKPLAGNGITLTETPDGLQINIGENLGRGQYSFNQKTITICEGGSPRNITVYGT